MSHDHGTVRARHNRNAERTQQVGKDEIPATLLHGDFITLIFHCCKNIYKNACFQILQFNLDTIETVFLILLIFIMMVT